LLAHGRCFSPDIPASSTTKTGRHDIAEILLKVALSTINQSIYWWKKTRVPRENHRNLQSWARTHAVLVIGLYELLGNPTI
jgi:hypothetical protein